MNCGHAKTLEVPSGTDKRKCRICVTIVWRQTRRAGRIRSLIFTLTGLGIGSEMPV